MGVGQVDQQMIMPGGRRRSVQPLPAWKNISQEQIIFAIAVSFAIAFALLLPGFASVGNALALLRSISVLGILATGMAVVVLGRGIDLSLVAIAIVSSGFTTILMINGTTPPPAMLAGLLAAIGMGALNGFLVASLKLPALLVTIATALLFVGLARITFLTSMITPVPAELEFLFLFGRNWNGIPVPLIVFVVLALCVSLFLKYATPGRFIYAHGDNPEAARLAGLRIISITVLEYAICAAVGFLAGLIMIASTGMVNLRVVGSTLVFDVLMVVVLGGVSLAGGRGGILGVISGVLLIGVIINGMTIMDLNPYLQSIIKGLVLLFAIVMDKMIYSEE